MSLQGNRGLHVQLERCAGEQRDPGCTPVETDRVLVSRVHLGLFEYFLDGCIGFAHDGEGGPTSSGGLGMPRITAVWGHHIDGEGTIVTESLDVSPFAFHFGELAIGPELATSVAFGRLRSVGRSPSGTRCFGGSGGKGRLPIPTSGSALLALAFPVTGVAPQGVGFELLECCGTFQRHELILDMLSKSTIELTIEGRIIPTRVCCMFRKLDHVFFHMLVILHFECTKSAFRSLGEIGLPKEDVQLFHKLTPITMD